MIELTQTLHQSYSRVLHINPPSTTSGIDRATFDVWRRSYWITRARDFE